MQVIIDFLGFVSVMVAAFWIVMYISWELLEKYADRMEEDKMEQDYIVTKDGEKIPYDEDTQE